MRVLINGINFSPELTGIGKYTGEMASWLVMQGHDVRVVTAPPYYPAWHVADNYTCWHYHREAIAGVDVWRCPLWVPSSPSGLKRLFHLLSFAISSLPVMIRQVKWRPDIIIVVEPSLFCAPQALLTAYLARGKSWLHVQDFEVAAFFGLGFASSGLLKRACIAIESCLMRRFDMVSSISKAMVDRLVRLGVSGDKTFFFPNWVDCNAMRTKCGGIDFRREWMIANDCKVVLYSGNMGRKQGLEIVLDVAEKFARQRPDVLFVMVGDGAAKQELVAEAKRRRLQNIIFKPLQPLADLPSLLSMADIHLVIQKRGAADAVLPSKLNGILAVGGFALITADQHTELGRLVNDNPDIALLVEPENKDALVKALLAALDGSSLRERGGCLAREYAEHYLDIDNVLKSAELRICQLVSRKNDNRCREQE